MTREKIFPLCTQYLKSNAIPKGLKLYNKDIKMKSCRVLKMEECKTNGHLSVEVLSNNKARVCYAMVHIVLERYNSTRDKYKYTAMRTGIIKTETTCTNFPGGILYQDILKWTLLSILQNSRTR